MEQPSIELFGVMILEPVTSLTDVLVSVVCFRSFILLQRRKEPPQFFSTYSIFILLMGFATLYGGIVGHALLYKFGFEWKVPAWLISMLSIGFAERGAILHARAFLKRKTGDVLVIANVIEIIFMVSITLYTLKFLFVEIHATYGLLLVVFSLEIFVFRNTREKGSRLILAAILIAALSFGTHLAKWSPHTWFNYLDLSHVLMAISIHVFYLGLAELYAGDKAPA